MVLGLRRRIYLLPHTLERMLGLEKDRKRSYDLFCVRISFFFINSWGPKVNRRICKRDWENWKPLNNFDKKQGQKLIYF